MFDALKAAHSNPSRLCTPYAACMAQVASSPEALSRNLAISRSISPTMRCGCTCLRTRVRREIETLLRSAVSEDEIRNHADPRPRAEECGNHGRFMDGMAAIFGRGL